MILNYRDTYDVLFNDTSIENSGYYVNLIKIKNTDLSPAGE